MNAYLSDFNSEGIPMVIPDTITIAGVQIEIVKEPGFIQKTGAAGMACYEEQKIFIDPCTVGIDILQQTFIHEVVHFILYVMGKHDLKNDEEFVDGFAHLAYQVIKDCCADADKEGIKNYVITEDETDYRGCD